MPKQRNRPVSIATVDATKEPISVEDTGSFFGRRPAWRFSISDIDHERWSVLDNMEDVVKTEDSTGSKVVHIFSKSIDADLLQCLKDRENMPWSEIITQNGGRGRNGGTNSHYVYVHELIDEARQRASDLKIDSDQLFSMRLASKKRVYGILEDGVLDVVWFDRTHEIYRVSR